MADISNKSLRNIVRFKYGGYCAYCGHELTDKSFTIDHIEPLKRHVKGSKIALNKIYNFNPCCHSCNSSKSSFTLSQWREQLLKKLDSLNRNSSQYRLLKRFGLVQEIDRKVVFFFERNEKQL